MTSCAQPHIICNFDHFQSFLTVFRGFWKKLDYEEIGGIIHPDDPTDQRPHDGKAWPMPRECSRETARQKFILSIKTCRIPSWTKALKNHYKKIGNRCAKEPFFGRFFGLACWLFRNFGNVCINIFTFIAF